jgi:hypothetical protein
MSMNVNDCEAGGDVEEGIEIEGVSLTWLTRMKLPFDGEMDANLTERLMLGVKLAGIISDGRRLALRSDSINSFVAIVFL